MINQAEYVAQHWEKVQNTMPDGTAKRTVLIVEPPPARHSYAQRMVHRVPQIRRRPML